MNIEKIRNAYDPENDAHPVTWAEMALAEEQEYLRNYLIEQLMGIYGRIGGLQDEIRQLKLALGDKNEPQRKS